MKYDTYGMMPDWAFVESPTIKGVHRQKPPSISPFDTPATTRADINYGVDMVATLEDCASMFSISRDRARQVQDAAIAKLAKWCRLKGLKFEDFL